MIPRWLILCVVTLLFWGAWTVVPKALPGISGFQQQALSTLGLLPIIGALAFSRKLKGASGPVRGSVLAFASGVLVSAGNVAYYQALNEGAKATLVVPLTALYPLVTVVLAMLFLGEKPHGIQVGGIALALGAIYLFNPLGQGANVASVGAYVVLPIALWGVAGLLQKVSTRHVSGELATMWFLAAFLPVAAGILLFDRGGAPTLSAKSWGLLVLLGLLFGLGNLTLIAAYATGGKASVVTPLSGLYSIVSIPLAVILFGELIGLREGAGIALALVAVVALSRERTAVEAPEGGAACRTN